MAQCHKTLCLMEQKKRIGIVTIVKVNNYGAELQAYATQKKMNLLGYDAELIDYLYYRNAGHVSERSSRPFYPYPLKDRLKEWGLKGIDVFEHFFRSASQKRKEERFNAFHRDFNRFSEVQYRRHSEIFNNPPLYDAYCVGSDQVWNPRCYTNLDAYFLDFAPEGKRRFSYASSFGVSEVPESAREKYAHFLRNIDALSVREQSGVGLAERLSGKKTKLVADPTLLLTHEEWKDVARPIEGLPERYVLVYELHPIPYLMEVAQYVAKKQNIPIVRLCKNARSTWKAENVINVADAGPSEFITLFDRACSVVTNSFHGTAFSVNFHKDFYCVLTPTMQNNGRQESLLRRVGLEQRLIYANERKSLSDLQSISYDEVEKQLSGLRNESIQYIKEAVG